MRAPATGQRGQQRAYEGGAEQERADQPGLGEGHHLGAVRESRPLRALALSQVGAPEVVRTGPHERRVLELIPRYAPVVEAIGGEAGAQPARSLGRAVTALLELVPGVGGGRKRVAFDDRVSHDDGDGRERDGHHRRGADAARARRRDLNASFGHRGQGAENGESRACEQQRPQRAVEDGAGRARGLQVGVHVEQRVHDEQDRRADGGERRDGPAASGNDEDGQHGNDRKGYQPAAALAEERRAGEQARGAQEQPAQRGRDAPPPREHGAGKQAQHPEPDVRVRIADRVSEAALVEVLDRQVRSRGLQQLDQGDRGDPEPVAAEEDRGRAAAQRPERAQREDHGVQQGAVARVPRELRLLRPEHGDQAERPVAGEQEDRRQREPRRARPRQQREAGDENDPEQQRRRHPRRAGEATLVGGEPEQDGEHGERRARGPGCEPRAQPRGSGLTTCTARG